MPHFLQVVFGILWIPYCFLGIKKPRICEAFYHAFNFSDEAYCLSIFYFMLLHYDLKFVTKSTFSIFFAKFYSLLINYKTRNKKRTP